jgi:hypothetical protein
MTMITRFDGIIDTSEDFHGPMALVLQFRSFFMIASSNDILISLSLLDGAGRYAGGLS